MASPNLVETGCNFALDPDDTTNPDLQATDWQGNLANSWSFSVAIGTPFFLRTQVKNTGDRSSGNVYWQLFFNTTDNPATATQVTAGTDVRYTDDGGSNNIANASATTARRCADPTGTWQNGEYMDTQAAADKLDLGVAYYTEFMWCLTGLAAAAGNTYYFWLYCNGGVLDSYDGTYTATVTFESL